MGLRTMRPLMDFPRDRLLTIVEIARICNVSVKTVRRWVERGELTVHRLGRQDRVAPADLEIFLKIRRNG
jgi:excisionase family DNA binding protein